MLLDKIGKQPMYFDGAMGTELIKLKLSNTRLTEMLNITDREIIRDIHKSYLEAGSDFITTNTFGANKQKFNEEGQLEEIIKQGVLIAKEACENYKDKYVMLDIGPSGEILEPVGEATFDEVYDGFKKQVIAGNEAGCDGILFETFTDLYELKAAVLAAKENTDLPVFCTMSFEKNGYTFFGTALESMIITLEGLGVDALGVNCSYGPHELRSIVEELSRISNIPIIVQPNAGLPVVTNQGVHYDMKADDFSDIMKEFADMGIAILGGCCGTNPEYIKSTIDKTKGSKCRKNINKEYQRTVVCSSRKTVYFEDVVIVGERINPTGKIDMQNALKSGDMDYLNSEAIAQVNEGANILDVNVGMGTIDEVKVLEETVCEIQSTIDIPLQIDSANYKAIERVVRIYNGKPIINSVNGTKESLDNVLPIAKKYGACVIALTLDENGIPKTANDKLNVARKIVEQAEKIGIKKQNIIVDCLVVTVATEQSSASETIEAVRLIKSVLGVKTILGISNISFGLPNRSLVNRTFLAMALTNGLDSAIINPADKQILDTLLTYKMLKGNDGNMKEYINNYNGKEYTSEMVDSRKINNTIGSDNNGVEIDSQANGYDDILISQLKQFIKEGREEEGRNIAIEVIHNMKPLDIIEGVIIPTLDDVGKSYESGKIFLPELIKSSETAKVVCDSLQKGIVLSDSNRGLSKDKIILATVHGDIHDIGKNIVKVILESYNFEVIDLGKDVSTDIIIKAIIENKVNIVALSALLTTSIKSMENTIAAIKEEFNNVRVIVGGAVLNKDISEAIGADFFARNAMDTVKYAQNVNK